MTNNKEPGSGRTLMYFFVSLCIIFAVVAALVFAFMQTNRERITKQNVQYLEDVVTRSVKRIDGVLNNGRRSIIMVSRLYELQLDKPEFDYHMLNDMSEPTPFDHIRFVNSDGISYSGDGRTIDCSDRKYYQEGIKGNSGMDYVSESRFTNNPLLIFYAPLYYNGEIIGVVDGVIESDNYSDELKSTFFGVDSNLCVCLHDGTIALSSWDKDSELGRAEQDFFSYDFISPEQRNEAIIALKAGCTYSFRYSGLMGKGIACMAPLSNGEFILVQTFPEEVSDIITRKANSDALKLEISIIVTFILYIAIVVVYTLSSTQNIVREKNDLGQIVDSVKQLYKRFVVFDLEKDEYEYLEKGDIITLGLPPEGKYSDWLNAFREQHNKDPRFWSDMSYMEADNLRTVLTKEKWNAHREYPTPEGRWERLSLIKLDLESKETKRILAAVEDITDVKLRDEENRRALETAFRTAEAASRAKSDFLSRMSHDIRTPMNAIIGLTAIMGAHLDERDRIVDCLAKITSSSKHLLGLINEVLDMSKIESGKLVLTDAEFNLSDLMDDMLSIIQPNINSKHLELSVQIKDVVHENVIGDSLRLQQICVNILSNAVKYTNEGGHISMTLSERPVKSSSTSEYEFVVEDDGIGMSEEFLKRIFKPFERADDERVSEMQGTGLGMSIAHSIANLMGGYISVKSELHKGSKFTVRVPLKLQESDIENAECLIGLPVLVADDEQVACETTCLMLNDLGMQGEWVLTGKEAVERTAEHHKNGEDFFAVILDWRMPGMDGVETAKAIRKEVGDDVPIIILSAYDWSEIEEEARAAGVNAFIGKPLFKSRLRSVFVDLVSDSGKHDKSTRLDVIKEKDYSGKRALLVEDNALNQEIAQEILEMTGLTVDVAENGKAAVDMFEASAENFYDIVFMDIQMPVMNGYEATRTIRALKRGDAEKIPIVAMSANTFSDDIRASLDSGMVQHIAKPISMDNLAAVLEKWLEN